MVIVTYRHKRRRPTRKQAQSLPVEAPPIVTARKPKRYQRPLTELPDDPEAQERVRQFFIRMGLGKRYDEVFK